MKTSNQNVPEAPQNASSSKIILFANQKGGVGKTTLCGLFCNYLVSRGINLLAIDADPQQNLAKIRKGDVRELELNYPDTNVEQFLPYNVRSITLKSADSVKSLVDNLRTQKFSTVIDTPGSITQEGLINLFINSDYIICPYFFDLNTIISTRSFCAVIHKTKLEHPEIKTKIIFLCNRKKNGLGTGKDLEAWDKMNDYFRKFGTIVPTPIGDYKSVLEFTTISNSLEVSKRVNPSFDYIYNIIYGGTEDV